MARSAAISAKRTRVSVDVSPATRRRLRLAAARRDVSVGKYLLQAIEDRLAEDLGSEGLLTLTAKADPVLAELWDNTSDAAYDLVSAR